jgi:hypothetical protein
MYAVNALFICFHCSDKANLIFRIDKQIKFLKFQSQISQTLSSVTYHFFFYIDVPKKMPSMWFKS